MFPPVGSVTCRVFPGVQCSGIWTIICTPLFGERSVWASLNCRRCPGLAASETERLMRWPLGAYHGSFCPPSCPGGTEHSICVYAESCRRVPFSARSLFLWQAAASSRVGKLPTYCTRPLDSIMTVYGSNVFRSLYVTSGWFVRRVILRVKGAPLVPGSGY